MVIDLGDDVEDTDLAAEDFGEHEEVDTALLLRGIAVRATGGVEGIAGTLGGEDDDSRVSPEGGLSLVARFCADKPRVNPKRGLGGVHGGNCDELKPYVLC